MGVEREPVWSEQCSGDTGLQLVHLASENAQQRNKTDASGKLREMLYCVQCDVATRCAGVDLLRLHYRDHHLQEVSHI